MKIRTVLGDISPDQLKVTLTHEHFSLDFHKFYSEPPKQIKKFFNGEVNEKIHLKNVGFVRQYPYGSKFNINFGDEETHKAVIEDVKQYKEFGGNSIVENTTHGIERNLKLVYEVAQSTGVQIICGTGHYLEMTQKPHTLNMSIEDMIVLYTNEIINGVEVPLSPSESVRIKCGFIGEVGSVFPITDFEKKAIQATADVQSNLKCGVSFHPGRDSRAPFEILRIYLEAGGDKSKCVMSHLDRTLLNDEKLLEFSDIGCYCQLDLFGTEVSWYQLNPQTDMPSDAQRVDRLKLLCDHGKLERILVSHDIHTKHRLTAFGGHGFAHLLNNVKPKMLLKGFNDDALETIFIKNPANWLEF
ncbi:CLUMA_CG001137, isoform A [Clunio marinus]|uniref:CLUMA_CG001137, isoform A n=1 Tax=Clunio marinus TaxID=568069 RepID=A0A1J1HH38_9DIPT|nr:CLUMA_CG001137, isoform A [Clunio marinus]